MGSKFPGGNVKIEIPGEDTPRICWMCGEEMKLPGGARITWYCEPCDVWEGPGLPPRSSLKCVFEGWTIEFVDHGVVHLPAPA